MSAAGSTIPGSETTEPTPASAAGQPRVANTRDAIVVCARFRPENPLERRQKGRNVVSFHDGKAVTVDVGATDYRGDGREGYTFTFDRAFAPDSTQEEVYNATARPIVQDVIDGYYATVFAYGQTGSGKTFTMEGPHDGRDDTSEGVIPRAVKQLFDHVEQMREPNIEVTISASYVEIYMERVRDLLDKTGKKTNLEVRVDLSRGVYVDGATEVQVNSDGELLGLLSKGSHRRHVSATGMNEESSRSHAIFMINVVRKDTADLTARTGKLFLVDLAGSEMVSKTGASGQQLEEAKLINKSLSSLGLVIKALTERNVSFVPYRDSKLTRILQDSLGGSARACLIIACSPSSYNVSETISTLRFGTRAKFIRNKPRVHVGYGGTKLDELLQKKERLIEDMREEIAVLQSERAQLLTANKLYHDRFGDIAPTGEGAPPALTEVVESYQQHVVRMRHELQAIEREAKLTRSATAEVQQHLREERVVFGKVGAAIAGLVERFGDTIDGLREDGRAIGDMLHLGRWRCEEVLRKMAPLARAAGAVLTAATRLRGEAEEVAAGGGRKEGGAGAARAKAKVAAKAGGVSAGKGGELPAPETGFGRKALVSDPGIKAGQ
ncbi:unnamed protein product [Pedinophyceae sp. YPF-701]|nr:unnamed protein product [Pedinophyceae sp. YPF-701]